MNFEKLDRVFLTNKTAKHISDWSEENMDNYREHHDIPMYEGLFVLENQFMGDTLTGLQYFRFDEDGIHLRFFDARDETEMLRGHVPLSGKVDDIEVKFIVDGFPYHQKNHVDEYKRALGSLFLLIMNTFQYMHEHKHQLKQEKIHKQVKKKGKKGSSKNRVVRFSTTSYTIDTTIERSVDSREYERQIEAWTVRGHWRYYKSGKRVWIKPHIKGKGSVSNKTYQV